MTEIVGWGGLLGLTDGQIAAIRRAFDYEALDGGDDEEALDLAVAVYLSFRPVTFGQPELEVKLLLACTERPVCPVPIPVFRELNYE